VNVDQRRAAVIEALDAGTLPRDQPVKVWAGTGTERPCAACGSTLTPGDVEFELDFGSGVSVIVDRHCYAIWDEQRDRSDDVH
jgi:hypothetical protein